MSRRVAYITHYAELYGANRSLLDLILALRGKGSVEPYVILAQDGPMRARLEEHGIAHSVIPFATWMHKRVFMGGLHHRAMQMWRYGKAARARAKANKAFLAIAAQECRERRIEALHVNSAVIGVGVALAKMLAVGMIWHIRELPFAHYGFTVDVGRRAYARALRAADAVIAISEAVRNDLRKLGTGIEARVIPNGVVTAKDLDRLIAEPLPMAQKRTRFLQLGLFHPSKGQLEAVEAFAAVHRQEPETTLILAGSGRTEAVQDRIKELELTDVELPGFVEDPLQLLGSVNCLLQCSRDEAMGRTTVEAMACGLPVIGHASGGTVELIYDGVSGYLYATTEQLAERMLELHRNPLRAKQMGEAGQAMVGLHYTVERMADAVDEVYRAAGMKRKGS